MPLYCDEKPSVASIYAVQMPYQLLRGMELSFITFDELWNMLIFSSYPSSSSCFTGVQHKTEWALLLKIAKQSLWYSY